VVDLSFSSHSCVCCCCCCCFYCFFYCYFFFFFFFFFVEEYSKSFSISCALAALNNTVTWVHKRTHELCERTDPQTSVQWASSESASSSIQVPVQQFHDTGYEPRVRREQICDRRHHRILRKPITESRAHGAQRSNSRREECREERRVQRGEKSTEKTAEERKK
jgi:hypothetical protein